MTERFNSTPEKFWQSISPKQQDVCRAMTFGPWPNGISPEALTAIFGEDVVRSLVEQKTIKSLPVQQIARDFLDTHASTIDRLKALQPKDLSPEESEILAVARANETIQNIEGDFNNYQLPSKEIYDFIKALD